MHSGGVKPHKEGRGLGQFLGDPWKKGKADMKTGRLKLGKRRSVSGLLVAYPAVREAISLCSYV